MPDSLHSEQNLSVTSAGLALEGTLCTPANNNAHAVVLLIPGSGQLDRDQNGPTLKLNIFNEMAMSLAASGIASVRFDKRGCGESGGDYFETGHSDLLVDAQECLDAIRKHEPLTDLPCFLTGHSEGTLLASQLCLQNPGLQGQILLCPFLQNIEVVMQRQAQITLDEIRTLPGFKGAVMRFFLRLSGDQIKKQQQLMTRIKNSDKDSIKIRKQRINAKWLREMASLEPADLHAKVSVPTLAIGGSKDLQCLPTDIEDLRNVMPVKPETHLLENLTNILRPDADVPTTSRYKTLAEQPLDDRIVDIVTAWIKRQLVK